MENFLKEIESSFHKRFSGENGLKKLWKEISSHFPPEMETLKDKSPHLILAGQCGDMGLAILWIVQTVLVHRLVEICRHSCSNKNNNPPAIDLSGSRIGALAHSESPENPMIIEKISPGKFKLTGTKKYITGGLTADIIFVTARRQMGEKTDSLIVIPTSYLEKFHIEEVDLQSLNTINHGRLILKDLEISESMIIDCDAKDLRRTILILSKIERDLILESYIAYMQYLNDRLEEILGEYPIEGVILKDLLTSQKATTVRHIEDMKEGRKLETGVTDFHALVTSVRKLQEQGNISMDSLPDELKSRFMDLKFLQSMGKTQD